MDNHKCHNNFLFAKPSLLFFRNSYALAFGKLPNLYCAKLLNTSLFIKYFSMKKAITLIAAVYFVSFVQAQTTVEENNIVPAITIVKEPRWFVNGSWC